MQVNKLIETQIMVGEKHANDDNVSSNRGLIYRTYICELKYIFESST